VAMLSMFQRRQRKLHDLPARVLAEWTQQPRWYYSSRDGAVAMMMRAEIEQVFSVAFAAAKANAYVQQWQKEFPELWSDEQLARNVPLRVEFEQVYVFGTVAEAVSWAGGFGGDTGKGRNKRGWGSIVRVDPLDPADPVDAKRVTCIHKESSPFRQRLEARRQIKRMMREASTLVRPSRPIQ